MPLPHMRCSGIGFTGDWFHVSNQMLNMRDRFQSEGRNRSRRLTGLMFAVSLLITGLGIYSASGFQDQREAKPPDRDVAGSATYLDAQICQTCHAEIHQTYRQSGMARSLYRPTNKNVVEDYSTNNHLFHALSNRHYEMVQRNGGFYQRRYQLDSAGKEVNAFEQEITFVIGSGNHARTYLNLSKNGVLTQLPVTWYPQEKRWAMSPGYDQPRHDDFSRKITHSCMFCHNAYPPLPEKSDLYGHDSIFAQELPLGIDCQRCHGPGSLHVDLASSGKANVKQIRQAILNPAHLSSERQMDVCLQCHLQPTALLEEVRRFGRTVYSYKTGEPLEEYLVHFDLASPTPHDRFEINSSAYRLRQSTCFQRSQGRMTCTTCHNPHQPSRGSEAILQFRGACLKCHAQLFEVSPRSEDIVGLPRRSRSEAHRAPPNTLDCVKCHMPRRRTEDAVHVVMTDHLIQRNSPKRDPLAPVLEEHSPKEGQVVTYRPETLLPSEQDVYRGMGQVQLKSNLTPGLIRLRTILERDKPTVPEPYVSLAIAQVETGDFEAAESSFNQALRLDPHLVIPRRQLGDLFLKRGKLDQALEQYRQVLQTAPGHVEAEYGLGVVLLKKQQPNLAIAHFEKVLRKDSLFVNAYTHLGIAYFQQDKPEEAITQLHKALQINPDEGEAHYNLGVAFTELGRLQEAREAYRQALRISPDDVDAHRSLGSLCAKLGCWQESVESYKQVLRLKQEVERRNKGRADLAEPERLQEVIDALRQAIRAKPDLADAHYTLGGAYLRMGRWQEATDALLQSIRLRPGSAEAHINLGVAYTKLGRLQEAVVAYQKAIQIKADVPSAYNNLGGAYARLGRVPEAIDAFKQAIRLKPDDAGAHYNLGAMHLMLRDRSSALEIYHVLTNLDKERADRLLNQINENR
ncbi:MAG: tetratricopeptide repeat protein [Acidobacteria bacterium]|nr:tetratricopeptide repeat protein [Acidobacteriota bacterium]